MRSGLSGMDDGDIVVLREAVVDRLAEWRQAILQQQ